MRSVKAYILLEKNLDLDNVTFKNLKSKHQENVLDIKKIMENILVNLIFSLLVFHLYIIHKIFKFLESISCLIPAINLKGHVH